MEHNRLEELMVECPALEVVRAGRNRIEQFKVGELVRVLRLEHNKLNQLPELHLYNLEQVDMSHNQLTRIEGLKPLLLLKHLNLCYNRLSELPPMAYFYLNHLDLAHNNLSSLTLMLLPCL